MSQRKSPKSEDVDCNWNKVVSECYEERANLEAPSTQEISKKNSKEIARNVEAKPISVNIEEICIEAESQQKIARAMLSPNHGRISPAKAKRRRAKKTRKVAVDKLLGHSAVEKRGRVEKEKVVSEKSVNDNLSQLTTGVNSLHYGGKPAPRKHLSKKKRKLRSKGAKCIQRAWKCHRFREQLKGHRENTYAAVIIQKAWRCYELKRFELKDNRENTYAAVIIQKAWRCYELKRFEIEMHRAINEESIVVLQSHYRANKTRQKIRALDVFKSNVTAITVVQRCIRRHIVKKNQDQKTNKEEIETGNIGGEDITEEVISTEEDQKTNTEEISTGNIEVTNIMEDVISTEENHKTNKEGIATCNIEAEDIMEDVISTEEDQKMRRKIETETIDASDIMAEIISTDVISKVSSRDLSMEKVSERHDKVKSITKKKNRQEIPADRVFPVPPVRKQYILQSMIAPIDTRRTPLLKPLPTRKTVSSARCTSDSCVLL
eukprot:23825_1